MAFNFSVFKTRTLSAIVFASIMLTGLIWNQWSFLALFTVIHFGCWWEFHRLMEKIDIRYKEIPNLLRYSIMLIGVAYMLMMTNPVTYPLGVNVSLREIGIWLMIAMIVLFLMGMIVFRKRMNLDTVLAMLAGFLYISLSWGLMVNLRSRVNSHFFWDLGWVLPAVIIASIWINDTMAYLTGSFFGRRPLSSISPKKTWEGTIGGVILAILLVSYGGDKLFDLPFRPLIFISAIASIMGTFGDLLESKLKRMAGVKDSGQMMPGHGGFLDRFDSMLLATPYIWIFASLFL